MINRGVTCLQYDDTDTKDNKRNKRGVTCLQYDDTDINDNQRSDLPAV